MHAPFRLVLALTPLAASCLPPPLADCSDDGCLETSLTDTSGASASPTSDAPVHTVTGDDAGSTGSMSESGPGSTEESGGPQGTSTDAVNEKPEIYEFTLSKDQISEPGEVDLLLDASEDVVEVDVWYGDTMLATLPIAAFPYTFDVTSQAMCNGVQPFAVTVRDTEGLTDSSEPAELLCQLAAPGSEIYTRQFPGTTASGGTAVVALPDGAVIVAGVLDGRMAIWRLDPDGNLLPDWPKTIAGWTTEGVGDEESTATAVAIDPLGAIVIAGNIKTGFTTRRYLARLNDDGQPLWEDPGLKNGEEIAGLAVASTGEIAAGGAVRTNPDDPNPAFDSSTWVYPNAYHPSQGAVIPDVFGQPDTDPWPDEFNARSEHARAVVAREDGGFVVFGERQYFDGDDVTTYTRSTAQRYTNAGARNGALWTSPGLKFKHDAALAATVTETGFLAAGWCRHYAPGSLRQVCVQEFDADGALVGFFAETSPTQAEARAVAQDREHKIVFGGFLSKPGQTDAWVFASRGADQPLAWSQKYNGGGWDFATGVGCDLWGHCTWVGSTVVDGALVLVVSQRQP